MSTQTTTGSGPEDSVSAEAHEANSPMQEGSPKPSEDSQSTVDIVEPSEATVENFDPSEDGLQLIEDEEIIILSAEDQRIQELEKSLSELQARLRAVSSAYRQQQDDMTATRERLARQALLKEEVRRGEVVATLFDPVQNLHRSLDAGKKGSSMDDMILGLEMVKDQFLDAFKNLGLEEVPGQGTRFNPNLHEALSLVPVTDPSLDEIVIEVFSAGYRLGSRLITPARVIVGQLIEPENEGEEEAFEASAESSVVIEAESSAVIEAESSAVIESESESAVEDN